MDARVIICLGVAGCTAGSLTAEPIDGRALTHASAQPVMEKCALRIAFGSFATGIDRAAAARIERLLEHDPDVSRLGRSGHGPEGEYSLCVDASQAAAARLFQRLKSVAGQVRAPLSISTAAEQYSAPLFPYLHK